MSPVPVAAESGGLLCGLTCGVVAAALSGLPPGLDASFVVAACTVGMMAAMPLFGLCADRWGRKAALQLGTAVLLFASALFLVRASGSSVALCGRFLQGVGIGSLFAALPTYISETLPEDARGRGLALFQFFVLFGQVIGAFAGLLAARFLGTGPDVWRILLALPIIPSVLFLVTSLGFRESPAGRRQRRNGLDRRAVGALLSRDSRRPLVLVTVTLVLVSATASGPVMNFAVKMMRELGVSTTAAHAVDVSQQVCCLVATLGAAAFADRLGARRMLVGGAFGAALALAGMAIACVLRSGTVCAVALMLFALSFCFGPGVCVFVVMTELLPERIRAVGVATALFAGHATSATVAALFTRAVSCAGYGGVFAALSAIAFALTLYAALSLPPGPAPDTRASRGRRAS